MTTSAWVEKYRPTHIDDYVFSSKQVKSFVHQCINDGVIPNLMLSGVHGTGKTTLARILTSELGIDPMDRLIINSSAESGIEAVRTRITDFCTTFPMSPFKVVILEEGDGLSRSAQMALRYLMEDYHDTVKFIVTCNYPNKIIPEIHSRCQSIHIDEIDKDAVFDRIADIIDSELGEDKSFTDEEVTAIDQHINRFYPDLRKIINSLQQSTINNEIHPPAASKDGGDIDQAWEFFWKNDFSSYKTVKDFLKDALRYSTEIDENNFEFFYRVMYENVQNLDRLEDNDIHEDALPLIAEHLFRAYTVADQQINLDACLYRIMIEGQ